MAGLKKYENMVDAAKAQAKLRDYTEEMQWRAQEGISSSIGVDKSITLKDLKKGGKEVQFKIYEAARGAAEESLSAQFKDLTGDISLFAGHILSSAGYGQDAWERYLPTDGPISKGDILQGQVYANQSGDGMVRSFAIDNMSSSGVDSTLVEWQQSNPNFEFTKPLAELPEVEKRKIAGDIARQKTGNLETTITSSILREKTN